MTRFVAAYLWRGATARLDAGDRLSLAVLALGLTLALLVVLADGAGGGPRPRR